ncbi:hypothetical protein HPB52_005588 [Rhipicephalus sanguineus]|uniref:Uncharacterized protein n=1 Tax=Rhipicephalus sanguineus TaxID=34632 RepID=A0A9D4T7N5_RHISA|nr:hypothetical protein HPB52_005588 [Rhipicephalus sanguineus]
MELLRTKRRFLRTVIAKGLSTLDVLLADSTTPVSKLQEVPELIVAKNAQLIGLDHEVQATLHDDELEADLTTSYEYDEKVIHAKTRVHLATASRPPNIAAHSVSTARPNNAPFTSKPQDAAISASTVASVSRFAPAQLRSPSHDSQSDLESAIGKQTPLVDPHPVPQSTQERSHVSVSFPKTFQCHSVA